MRRVRVCVCACVPARARPQIASDRLQVAARTHCFLEVLEPKLYATLSKRLIYDQPRECFSKMHQLSVLTSEYLIRSDLE